MANALDITLHALGPESSDGNGAWVDIGENRSAVVLDLFVSAASGTLTVYVETSEDQSGANGIGAFAANAVARSNLKLDRCARYVRVRWDLTTSATFSVIGEAHTLFAERHHVTGGSLADKALEDVTDQQWAECLLSASADIEDAVAHTNPMPLTKWPHSVTRRCADIAAWLLLKTRGVDPDSGADALIKDAYDEAQKWLDKLTMGKRKPPGLQPGHAIGAQVTSGNPASPDPVPKFSDNWGDFG